MVCGTLRFHCIVTTALQTYDNYLGVEWLRSFGAPALHYLTLRGVSPLIARVQALLLGCEPICLGLAPKPRLLGASPMNGKKTLSQTTRAASAVTGRSSNHLNYNPMYNHVNVFVQQLDLMLFKAVPDTFWR